MSIQGTATRLGVKRDYKKEQESMMNFDASAIWAKVEAMGYDPIEVMARLLDSREESIRFRAAKDLADRIYGKPKETLEHDVRAEQTFISPVPEDEWDKYKQGEIVEEQC